MEQWTSASEAGDGVASLLHSGTCTVVTGHSQLLMAADATFQQINTAAFGKGGWLAAWRASPNTAVIGKLQ